MRPLLSNRHRARPGLSGERGFRRLTGLLALYLMGSVAIGCSAPPQRPNIVILDLDTLRADHLGSYGYKLDTTPYIDALAERGSLFLRNYAQAGWTGPSQTSILTSMYASVHQVIEQGQVLDPKIPLLAEVLQDNGYATVAFSQLMGLSFRRGFDEYTWRDGEWETGPVDRDLESTLKEMQEWVGRQAQPFFLFMHTYQVHLGYKPLEKYKRRFVSPYYDGPLRDLDITENLMREMAARGYPAEELTDDDRDYVVALYDAELAHLDDVIGRFLDSLDRLGLSDNTLVVVLSDHGEEFGERGYMARHGTLYDEVIRTPLIIAGPGVPVGREFNQRVRNIDIAPTLLSLAGLEIPEVWQGSSLEPIWTGSEQESREVFSENPNWDDATLVIDRFKIFANGHLIDLQKDPGELVDVASERPLKGRQMWNRLTAIREDLWEKAGYVAGPVQLTQEELRQLKALGYLQ